MGESVFPWIPSGNGSIRVELDGLPIEVHGHQGGSAFHGLYGARIYSPLVASLAETGDMVGGLLREGNAARPRTPIPGSRT